MIIARQLPHLEVNPWELYHEISWNLSTVGRRTNKNLKESGLLLGNDGFNLISNPIRGPKSDR